VVLDRLQVEPEARGRLVDSLELALAWEGPGLRLPPRPRADAALLLGAALRPLRHHLPRPHPQPLLLQRPGGRLPDLPGFGRIIEIDPALVVPDDGKTIRQGPIRPWTTESFAEGQTELERFCRAQKIPLDVPWKHLASEQRRLIWEGTEDYYGVAGFFRWLESRIYRNARAGLLSRYRTYLPAPTAAAPACGRRPSSTGWGGSTWPSSTPCRWTPSAAGWSGSPANCPMMRPRGSSSARSAAAWITSSASAWATSLSTAPRAPSPAGGGAHRPDHGPRHLAGQHPLRPRRASIGLHPRDVGRLVEVLHGLRDAGNTWSSSSTTRNWCGRRTRPSTSGRGRGGGGPGGLRRAGLRPARLRRVPDRALPRGGRTDPPPGPPARAPPRRAVRLEGAAEHNLKGIAAEFPLGLLTCVTGVSGSGRAPWWRRSSTATCGGPSAVGRSRTGLPAAARASRARASWRRWCWSTRRRWAPAAGQHRHLPGGLHLDPAALRRRRAGRAARLHRGDLLLQRRGRPLPRLPRQRPREGGDAVPGRPLPPLPGVRGKRYKRRCWRSGWRGGRSPTSWS